MPCIKSDHLYTSPLPVWQHSDISMIKDCCKTWLQTLTFVKTPLKDCVELKPPATESCSCPSIKEPPALMVYPVFKPQLPFAFHFSIFVEFPFTITVPPGRADVMPLTIASCHTHWSMKINAFYHSDVFSICLLWYPLLTLFNGNKLQLGKK